MKIKVFLIHSKYIITKVVLHHEFKSAKDHQLNDDARKENGETIQFKLQYHRDPERAESLKQIKKSVKNISSEYIRSLEIFT